MATNPAVSPGGLYAPDFEHDACGVAMVADLAGRRDHSIVRKAITALLRLEHRGARGAEVNTGDGAGILIQVPDEFFRAVVDFELPPAGGYAVGNAFLPADREAADAAVAEIERLAAEEDLRVLGWRALPVDPDKADIGPTARAVMPGFRQLFVAGAETGDPATAGEAPTGIDLERRTFCLRKRVEHGTGVYFPSLSPRTIVYKGMLTEPQVVPFYPDLADERVTSALAVVHSRFSTNTFPAWPLAHPYRYVAHNGEINTLRGNRNWMAAREALLESDVIPGDLRRLTPIVTPDASDSATFDEVLELLHLAGRSLPHAVLMMIPEAWENHEEMDPERRAFYEFHSCLMEPWDGPALVAFTDGTQIGAVLDRNGLRPARWWVTEDGTVVLASEVGVLDVDPSAVVRKGRLEPGKMFLVDTAAGRVVDDAEIKGALATELPYEDWLHAGLIRLGDLKTREREVYSHAALTHRQQAFGYTEEELNVLLKPMAGSGAEPIGSMGNDAPLAAISERPRQLYDYFTQLFAQVTNPPLDAIREELVTSLQSQLGPEQNLLEASAASCRTIVVPFPVLGNDDLAKIVHINDDGEFPGFASCIVRGTFPAAEGGAGLRKRLAEINDEVSAAIADGARLIVLSSRGVNRDNAPIPSLLLTGAVHHHLVRERSRTRVGLIVESGDAREVHHIALLIGYGAAAVNPYLAMATVEDLAQRGDIPGVDAATAAKNLVKALGKGVRKTMSKMGVSTVASYTGAQIFEAFGLGGEVIGSCFTGTTSRLGGVGFDVLAEEVLRWHRHAYPADDVRPSHRALTVGGEYQWRREGELHLFNPSTVFKLQHSTRQGRYEVFKDYTRQVDEQAQRLMTLRGLFRFKTGAENGARPPVPIDEVEPVEAIVQRFATGAISYGSISQEMHETLAIAMNRLGGRSNTGEGGEDAERYTPDPNGDSRNSAVKQVASGRFGVTSEYLVSARDLQIKIAQGAKPGGKVYPCIART
ncbi:MAG TPA: glutamate synthase central domain-containing protein, partial [Pseudonocardia sp.]|nr:glutamate synthase central domain-containing protein [Pseudonocardia sp.]